MNLHHKALRHFISASVIVLTSSFLIYELIASDRAMNAYMRYIMERADSSFCTISTRIKASPHIWCELLKRRETPSPQKNAARFATPLRLLTVRTASTWPGIIIRRYMAPCKPPLHSVPIILMTPFTACVWSGGKHQPFAGRPQSRAGHTGA